MTHAGGSIAAVLLTITLITGCSAEIPPGARGPLWENVVAQEARSAAAGRLMAGGIIRFGFVIIVAGLLLLGSEAVVTGGVGQWRLFDAPVGVAIALVGLAVVGFGAALWRHTSFRVRVADGSARPKRSWWETLSGRVKERHDDE